MLPESQGGGGSTREIQRNITYLLVVDSESMSVGRLSTVIQTKAVSAGAGAGAAAVAAADRALLACVHTCTRFLPRKYLREETTLPQRCHSLSVSHVSRFNCHFTQVSWRSLILEQPVPRHCKQRRGSLHQVIQL